MCRRVGSDNDATVQRIPSAGLPFGDRRRQGMSNQFFSLLRPLVTPRSWAIRRFAFMFFQNLLDVPTAFTCTLAGRCVV